MRSVDERLAAVEARLDEFTQMDRVERLIGELRQDVQGELKRTESAIARLDIDMRQQFAQVRADHLQGREDTSRQFVLIRTGLVELGSELSANRVDLAETRTECYDALTDLRTEVTHLRTDVTGLREGLAEVRSELLQHREEMASLSGMVRHLDQRMGRLETKVDHHFQWLLGLQFTMMLTVLGVMLGAFLR
jgi:chromosome segregation ATPase